MKCPNRMPRRATAGFTLVELSIVLVIIGLLIGGVLTGQQIIQNARITNAVQSIQAYEAQFQTYAQNYGFLPGDDPNAVTRFVNTDGSAIVGAHGNGDGILDPTVAFDTTGAQFEERLVWAEMRAAGLIKSQLVGTDLTVQPLNPFNGIFGFQTGAFNGQFTTTVLCLNNVPAQAAQAIDSRLDDGNSNSGNIQAIANSVVGQALTATVAASYGPASTYTMCIRM